jgi:hypothetical protein
MMLRHIIWIHHNVYYFTLQMINSVTFPNLTSLTFLFINAIIMAEDDSSTGVGFSESETHNLSLSSAKL